MIDTAKVIYSYCPSTETIRTAPGNHWVASMNSWDGAVDKTPHGHLLAAAGDLRDACDDPDLDDAHDELSALLEDPGAGNDEIRAAAIQLCECLNEHHEERRKALAKARGEEQ